MNKRSFVIGLTVFLEIAFCWQNNIWAASGNDIERIIKRYQQETKCEHVSVVVFDNRETIDK